MKDDTTTQNLAAVPAAPCEGATPPECGKNSEAHKESAKLAIELTKQFLTLAVGSVGFVVGLLSSNAEFIPKWLSTICLLGFASSIVCGLFFFMGSVWEINQNKNFDVFTPHLRRLAKAQLFLFLIFVAVVGFFAVKKAYSPVATAPIKLWTGTNDHWATLEVQNGSNVIRQSFFERSRISLMLSNNHLTLQVTPQP